jgi:hypothetical protein
MTASADGLELGVGWFARSDGGGLLGFSLPFRRALADGQKWETIRYAIDDTGRTIRLAAFLWC